MSKKDVDQKLRDRWYRSTARKEQKAVEKLYLFINSRRAKKNV